MSGLNFPNYGNALLAGTHAAYYGQKADMEAAEEERRKQAEQYVQPALKGDSAAMGKLASLDPKQAVAVTTALSRMDANQRAQAKEQIDWSAGAANAVLQASPAERPAVYATLWQQGKDRGYKMTLPPQYTPQIDSQLRSLRMQAVPIQEWFKQNESMPTPMGGAPAGDQTAAAPNREQFVQMMTPHVLEASRATGIDPRIIMAQAALETGWGTKAPGNNYFGVKSHGAPGGQMLTTTEVGPNGPYQVQDSFRTYANPGESARDYAEFLKTNGRYQPLLTARGFDAQVDALGKSGYATDPQYAAKVRQLAQGFPAMDGTTPVTQGDANVAQAPAAPEQGLTRGLKLPPGARMMGIKGVPVVKDGNVLIQTQDGGMDWVPLPKANQDAFEDVKDQTGRITGQRNKVTNQFHPIKDQGGQTGPFTGNSVEAQALNKLILNGTLTEQQASELAAGKTITNPADGSVMFMTPSGLFRGQQVAPPTAPGGAPAATQAGQTATPPAQQSQPQTQPGMIPVTPPKPQTMTEGQANAALYADRMMESEPAIQKFEKAALSVEGKLLEKVPIGGNFLQTPEYRQYEQARRDFINAVLRRESGAVISDHEFANADKQYFPQPGDDKDTLARKQRNRQVAIEGIRRAAGPAYKPPAAKADSGPQVGTIEDGYRFKGGDPTKQENWEPVQ